jgi:predicted RNA-binding Zn-ribbon protein involved in translation (DUF1610 family)
LELAELLRRDKMAKLVVNLNCPSCGGVLQIEEGDSLVLCPYCNTASTTGSYEREKTLLYQFRISRDEVTGRVKRWFSEGNLFQKKARDLKNSGVITEAELIYLPFWRMIGQGRAIVCGYNKEQVDNKTTIDYKEVDRSITCDWNGIACNADEIGVKEITIPEGEVKSVDEEELSIFETSESFQEGIERAASGIRDIVYNDASSGISNVTYAKSFVTPISFSKILYPFWVIRYSYQNRGYFAVVDGQSSAICSGRAPGDVGRQVSFGSFGAILTGIIGGLIIFYFIDIIPQFDSLDGDLFVILPLLALLVIGSVIGMGSYQSFRYGSEIIEGDLPGVNK